MEPVNSNCPNLLSTDVLKFVIVVANDELKFSNPLANEELIDALKYDSDADIAYLVEALESLWKQCAIAHAVA